MQIILGGNCGNSKEIAEAIAKRLGLPFYRTEIKEFRDTELLVRIPVENIEHAGPPKKEFRDMDVIYVQSTAPAQSKHLLELFLTAESIKRRGARTLTLVVPYLAHARQDKEFTPGEVISNRVIGKIMRSLGVDRLFTVDVHFNREVGEYTYEGISAYNVTAAGALAKYIRDELGITSPEIFIPDLGHKPIAEFITPILGDDLIFGRKERRGETEVQITFTGGEDINGKPAVIFDDMISTGTTCIATAQYIKKRKASKVILAVTHTLYLNEARDKLLSAGIDKIVATDTIPKEDSVVSVAPTIADAIERIHEDRSVSSLFMDVEKNQIVVLE